MPARSGRAFPWSRAARALRSCPALLLLVLAWSMDAAAQGAPAVALHGRVLARDGSPVAGARLQARDAESETESAVAVTDAGGKYSLRLRAGREYVLSVERTGFIGGTLLVEIPAGSAGVVRDVRLVSASQTPTALDSLIVRAPPRTPEPVRRGREPGASLASRSAHTSTQHPGEPGDLLASAGNSGQFVPVGRSGLSVAGQAPSANRTTLDGAGFDAGSVPPEALAAAGVFTHPYDVSRGQFTGGEIAGRTMSGTNLWGGAIRGSIEDPHLRYGGNASQGRSARIGGGGGGPIVPGRAFVYGAGQFSTLDLRQRPLDPADPRLRGYGISADSARRLLQIVSGLGLDDPRGRAADGGTRSGASVVRFDFLPGTRHSLALRLDARGRQATGLLNSPFSASGGGSERELSGGVLLQAVSKLGRGATHEANLYRSRSDRRSVGRDATPAGRVLLDSELADGRRGSSLLFFAGDALSWPDEDRSALEITDRVVVPINRGRHRLQAGGLYSRERVGRSAPTDRFGTFTFASLADLEAGRPLQYTRWLGTGAGGMSATSWAAYTGDVWTPRPSLGITYGIRAERTSYDGAAGVDSGFGLAAAPPTSPWSVSPRAGFKWSRSNPVMDWVVRGGAGRFRAGVPTRSLAALLAEPGLSGDVRLVCVGAAVPVPRWESYRADPGTIPRQCATDSPELSSDRPGSTGFAPGYDLPAVWHSSMELNWLHRPSLTSIDAHVSMSRGRGLPLATDRNLAADPAFRLESEGGRPVFVAPGAVDPSSGRIVLPGSRRLAELGVVREVDASGRSASEQASLTLARLTGVGLVQAYYTYTRSRDDASALLGPGGPTASTGGDPRRATWGPADFEQRHVFQLSLDRTLASWSTVTLLGRVFSGLPFTPTVDGDVNGDGFANDRAFVFGPADRDVGAEMAALIDGAPAGVRACLRGQLGRVAGRNSCRTPWNPQLDVQLNIRPGGLQRGRTAFTIVAQNATAALDRLLHGADDLRGWGQDPYPDPVLLRVTGFEPGERRFRYQVNPSFGRDAVSRIPFTIRIQGRFTLGADPATQALVASVSNLKASMTPDEVKREILRQWANVPGLVLAYAAPRGLALTDAQAQRLRVSGDSVALGIAALAASLADPGPEETATPSELLAHAQRLLTSGFDTARAVLTREQWGRLPRLVRQPPRAVIPISAQGGIFLAPDL